MLPFTEHGRISEKSEIIQKLELLVQSLRTLEEKRSVGELGIYLKQLTEITNQINHLIVSLVFNFVILIVFKI